MFLFSYDFTHSLKDLFNVSRNLFNGLLSCLRVFVMSALYDAAADTGLLDRACMIAGTHVLVVTMFSGYDRPLQGLFTALKGRHKPL